MYTVWAVVSKNARTRARARTLRCKYSDDAYHRMLHKLCCYRSYLWAPGTAQKARESRGGGGRGWRWRATRARWDDGLIDECKWRWMHVANADNKAEYGERRCRAHLFHTAENIKRRCVSGLLIPAVTANAPQKTPASQNQAGGYQSLQAVWIPIAGRRSDLSRHVLTFIAIWSSSGSWPEISGDQAAASGCDCSLLQHHSSVTCACVCVCVLVGLFESVRSVCSLQDI